MNNFDGASSSAAVGLFFFAAALPSDVPAAGAAAAAAEPGSDDSEHYYDEFDGPEASVLLNLVQSYDWAGALARIAAFPSETQAVGMQGRTPLHVACDHDAPAVVIQALLKAYPAASCMVGTSNMNPLHITCSSPHASVHVVRVLLDGGIMPEQVRMCDVDGDTPLHAACRCGAPMEVLEVLLRAHPAAVHQRDYEGLTPLLRLWVRYFVILGDNVIESVNSAADLTGELGEAWKKTELLLKCALYNSLDVAPSLLSSLAGAHTTDFCCVHAAALIDCPRPIVKIAAQIYPQRLNERLTLPAHLPGAGHCVTPLLLACQAPIYQVRDLSDDGYLLEDFIHGDNNDDGDVNVVSENDDNGTSAAAAQPSVIALLLESHPEAASAMVCVPDPVTHRLPLHVALATGKHFHDHGVAELVQVYSDALHVRDPVTKLYPFQMASAASGVDDEHERLAGGDLSTAFELLRQHPILLADGGRNDERKTATRSVSS